MNRVRRVSLKLHELRMVEYEAGWKLFASGQPLEQCANNDQRRGWQNAMRDYTNAECSTEYQH